MAKKRVTDFKSEYKKFLVFMDEKLKKIMLNGNLETSERIYRQCIKSSDLDFNIIRNEMSKM